MNKTAIAVFIAFLAFLFLGVFFGLLDRNPQPEENPIVTPSAWEGYTDQESGISFEYPPFASTSTPVYGFMGRQLVEFDIDRDTEFQGTNYAGEKFTVSIDENGSSECLVPDQSLTSEGSITIHGTEFKKYTTANAGAGNLYQSEVYRHSKDGTCIEIAMTLHTTNVSNYDPGTVTEVDRTEAWSVLKHMLSSVRISE